MCRHSYSLHQCRCLQSHKGCLHSHLCLKSNLSFIILWITKFHMYSYIVVIFHRFLPPQPRTCLMIDITYQLHSQFLPSHQHKNMNSHSIHQCRCLHSGKGWVYSHLCLKSNLSFITLSITKFHMYSFSVVIFHRFLLPEPRTCLMIDITYQLHSQFLPSHQHKNMNSHSLHQCRCLHSGKGWVYSHLCLKSKRHL